MKIKIEIPGLIHSQKIENEEDLEVLLAVLKKVENQARAAIKKSKPENSEPCNQITK